MADESKLPTGRLARMARMARVGARSGVGALLSSRGEGAAEQAAEILGSMRGIAAKVGQMASYVDGLVPDHQQGSYATALKKLQAAAPRSSFSEIKSTIEEELGEKLEALFRDFDPEPIASASIGQVHRAELPDGREVAVKVQHPGIDRAIESDLKNVRVLEGMMSLVGPRSMGTKQTFQQVADRFREELDYTLEAERQKWFRDFFEGDPHIDIPEVIESHSTRRVLTSAFVHGHPFDWATARPEAERRHFAELLWRFTYRSFLVGGRINVDPHPGNYIFHEEGRITFLDFGCVETMEPERRALAADMHLAAAAGDEAKWRRCAAVITETKPGPYQTALLDYLRECFRPLFDAPYRIESEYVSEVVRGIYQMKQHMLGRKSGFTPPPRGTVFLNRLQIGFYSVLGRFNVEADYPSVDRTYLIGKP